MTATQALNTTSVTEHRGHVIEASDCDGTIYVTVDGDELPGSFPSLLHGIDAGKRKVNRKAKAQAPKTQLTTAWWDTEGYAKRWAEAFAWDDGIEDAELVEP
jgi:hypothetical protein